MSKPFRFLTGIDFLDLGLVCLRLDLGLLAIKIRALVMRPILAI